MSFGSETRVMITGGAGYIGSLLNICGLRSERADPVILPIGTLKARIGDLLRKSVLASTYLLKCRLFGFGDAITAQNIIVTGIRPETDPLPERVAQTCSSSKTPASPL